jgi:hypothetical protein
LDKDPLITAVPGGRKDIATPHGKKAALKSSLTVKSSLVCYWQRSREDAKTSNISGQETQELVWIFSLKPHLLEVGEVHGLSWGLTF